MEKTKTFSPCLKNRFPFRLGATSYILADDVLPNVEFLGPLVDDVELVLFESEDLSNLPDQKTLARLKELQKEHRLTYTAHLPLDIELGSRDETLRKKSVNRCLRVMALCKPLEPFAHVLHFHGDRRGKNPSNDLAAWRSALMRSVEDILGCGVDPDSLCVETLDYPFDLVADIVLGAGLGVCLDVGHLAFHGYDLEEHLDKYWEKSRVLHLHGHEDGVDHKDIRHYDPGMLRKLLHRLEAKTGVERVLTLEIFNEQDFSRSLDVMESFAR